MANQQNDHQANPGVTCSVTSCKNHDEHNHCVLNSIKVEPMRGANTGKPADESMCGSYKNRG